MSNERVWKIDTWREKKNKNIRIDINSKDIITLVLNYPLNGKMI
jgi:hypothetical protein